MHESDTPSASRRDYLRATTGLAAAGLTGLAGCSSAQATTGTLATRVSDQPGDIGDFETCVVTIAGFWVKPGTEDEDDEDNDTTATATTTESESDGTETPDESDEREYYELESPQEADLVELQGDRSALIGEQELETGTYAYLQLDVTGVDATLADGGEATVTTPGNAPLQFKQSFEIREDTRTQFTADFTPVKRGQTGSYLLQPVASETTVSYESVEATATESGE
ncbi:DUF4382 domain-containing protein [Haloplanus sp. C73]|uniref:DUF4382 domain-containing protein n=1 Tax=Haloplanus sp. C73 TaxID=3421641 RepID=UPI003EBEB747